MNPTRSTRMTICLAGSPTTRLTFVTLFGHDHAWPTLAAGGYDTVREMLAFFDRQ